MSATRRARKRLRWEFITLASMYAGYAALMLCRTTLIASSAALISDPTVGIDIAAYGRLMGWHTAGGVLGKLALGIFADRLGGRFMFLVCLAVTALSTVAFGWVSVFYLFALLNFGGQFFKAGAWPAMAKIIGNCYSANKHGRVWAIISTSSRVGTFSAGLFVGALLLVVGWRTAFAVTGAVTAAVFVGIYFTLTSKPAELDLEAPEIPKPDQDVGAPKAPAHPLDGTTLLYACGRFASSPRVWLICLAMVFLTILMDFMVFIPIYLAESLELDPGQAAMAGSTFPIGMFAAMLASIVFYDRLSKNQLIYVFGGLLTLACGCAAMLWLLPSFSLAASVHLPVAIMTIFVFGFAISPAYYLPMSVFSIAHGGEHSGFLISFIDVCGYLGALIFAVYGGQIAQDYGWPFFLAGLLAICVLALLSMSAFLKLDVLRALPDEERSHTMTAGSSSIA